MKGESTLAADGTLTDQKTWQGSDLLAWTHYEPVPIIQYEFWQGMRETL